MQRWEKKPSKKEFIESYYHPVSKFVTLLEEDFNISFYTLLEDLNWQLYRSRVLILNPEAEQERVSSYMSKVEDLVGFKLKGDVILFAAFGVMDGYARFDRGTHQVFLGIDDTVGNNATTDILMAHELTHVARESRETVWKDFGLDLKMSHDDFSEKNPLIEHLMGEGLSCVVSEILVPNENPWNYVYQTQSGLAHVLERAAVLDSEIKKELLDPNGHYFRLYNSSRYGKNMPHYCHYVWAWQWVKTLVRENSQLGLSGIVSKSSKHFLKHALEFQLKNIV
jgi:hypothetical protein